MNRPTALQRIANEFTQQSEDEQRRHHRLHAIAQDLLPRYGHQWNLHQQVTMRRQTLSRLLYTAQLYERIVDVPGVVCEFGVQWGATLAQLINLRGMLEPYNTSRFIVGFDTFEGFAGVNDKDGGHSRAGDYATLPGYEQQLEEILALHESFSPLAHIRRFELVKGDASVTGPAWLERNPHAVVAMAIFDMDIYQPTRDVLQAILPRLTKGSLLVFDELSCPHFPGETAAVQELLGVNQLRLRRHPHQPYCAYAVYGD